MTEGHDIIVIGGSTGGIDAIRAVLEGLNDEMPAAVFVVVHSGQGGLELLARIFSKSTSLKVHYAEDREPIELGRVYVAPHDRHLLIKPGEVRVVRGPKENNFRPALDPLFRSAAHTYGARVMGVVMSGMLDDGTHGLMEIKRQRGVTIAQSPDDAEQPSMPASAIERVGVDFVMAAKDIGPLLNRLAGGDAGNASSLTSGEYDVVEGSTSALRAPGLQAPSSPFICPDCGGALWELSEQKLLRYRCHVGHGYTADTLLQIQSAELEQALWTGVRILEDQAELQRRMSSRWEASGNQSLRRRFEANAKDHMQAADLIRTLLTGQSVDADRAAESTSIQREYGLSTSGKARAAAQKEARSST